MVYEFQALEPDDGLAIADTISSPAASASLDFPGLVFWISIVTRVQKMGLLLLHWRYKLAGTPECWNLEFVSILHFDALFFL